MVASRRTGRELPGMLLGGGQPLATDFNGCRAAWFPHAIGRAPVRRAAERAERKTARRNGLTVRRDDRPRQAVQTIGTMTTAKAALLIRTASRGLRLCSPVAIHWSRRQRSEVI